MLEPLKKHGILSFLLPSGRPVKLLNRSDLGLTAWILILTSLLGELLVYLGFSSTNTVTIFILGVLLISVVTARRVYRVFASVASVADYN